MNKINTKSWKAFKISEIFITQKKGNVLQVPTGATVDKCDLQSGPIPRITVKNTNNGIFGYYKKNNNFRIYENFISVSFLGTVFYQNSLASLDMKVHCLKPIDHTLNEQTGIFLTSVILAGLKDSTYADQISSTLLPEMIIKLPVTSDEKPDWEYMQSYMQMIERKSHAQIEKISQIVGKGTNKRIPTDGWKEYHLYDENLFFIDSGTKLDKVKMDTTLSEIAFVGRSNINNGITTMVRRIPTITPYNKGNLTLALGGYLGSCFVQPNDFYTSQNVVVLIPKHPMSEHVKWFIASAIFVESQNNYKAFIKELNSHIKKDFKVKLPSKEDGTPDWDYMETCMKNIKEKAQAILDIDI